MRLLIKYRKEFMRLLISAIPFIHSRPENLALEGKDEKWPLEYLAPRGHGL